MSRNFMFLTSLSLFLFSTNCAIALTCRNDYSGTAGCAGNQNAAGNCETLGYYTDDVENCGHYIYCPFDTSYKRCTSFNKCSDYPLTSCPSNGICEDCPDDASYKKLTGCETGYELNSSKTKCIFVPCPTGYARDVRDCGDGTVWDRGWTLGTIGSKGCGKCIAKPCPGEASTEITSEKDCDNKYGVGRHAGYGGVGGYSGDNTCGYCRGFQYCEEAGLADYYHSGSDCDQVPVYSGNGIMLDCYDCPGGSGSGNSSLDNCLEDCKDDCSQNINNCAGYSACVNNCYVTYG